MNISHNNPVSYLDSKNRLRNIDALLFNTNYSPSAK